MVKFDNARRIRPAFFFFLVSGAPFTAAADAWGTVCDFFDIVVADETIVDCGEDGSQEGKACTNCSRHVFDERPDQSLHFVFGGFDAGAEADEVF